MMAGKLDVPWCGGGCGLSVTRHRTGCVFLGVVHFADRRPSKRATRNFLLLAARRDRLEDRDYLNVPFYDWWYRYEDATAAARMARYLHLRIPTRLWDHEREMCRLLAAKRGVQLSKHRSVWAWLRR